MLNILIIEDEMIIAEDLHDRLVELGYQVAGIAMSAKEAKGILATQAVDLALVDIRIQGEEDGIQLAAYLRDNYAIPHIFVSSHSDKNLLEAAGKTAPAGYIVKPIRSKNLYAAIEVARSSHAHASHEPPYLEINMHDGRTRIPVADILYLEAESNYTYIVTAGKKYMCSMVLKELLQDPALKDLVRVHRSFALHSRLIQVIKGNKILLENGHAIPIGRKYKDAF